MALCDENATPNSAPDPMAMLFAAQKETVAMSDQKMAVKVAQEMAEKQALEEEHLKAVLAMQSEEDSAAIEAEQQEVEDMRVAQLVQVN